MVLNTECLVLVVNVISKMGGSSITVAGGEIYQNLQSGAIDGAEWIGPGTMKY